MERTILGLHTGNHGPLIRLGRYDDIFWLPSIGSPVMFFLSVFARSAFELSRNERAYSKVPVGCSHDVEYSL